MSHSPFFKIRTVGRCVRPFLAASVTAVCTLALLFAAAGSRAEDTLKKAILEQAQFRSIGPAVMGGRIADIACDEKSPYTVYVALATGGLIKTENNGTTWTPLFDGQPVASVGAVAIAPSDPKVVWVGTGEANGRNSSSWGDGVYRSGDGGKTWHNVGLKESQEIGRIVVDPRDPNTVYVAAAGHLWGPNRERGVYKTSDGGKTWKHSLAMDADTGAIDVALGAPGSGIVYAAAYQRRRTPWGFSGIGSGSALYRSRDDGKTWQRMENGLPAGPVGRIGISVARSKPDTVYAIIESQQGGAGSLFDQTSRYGGVFRSDDAGEHWRRVSGGSPRGFYFGQIRVDPTDPERVYVLGFSLAVSEDGGKTFKTMSTNVHSDQHALWIDPVRHDRLLLGTDGGLYVSSDRAKTWDSIANFPMGEFYEIKVDDRRPFWVYGGLQDNGSWAGPSALFAGSGPSNGDWSFLEGGDGFYVVPDPARPDVVYAESQGAGVVRIDRATGLRRGLHPTEPEGQPAYRFNWNSPICLSPFDSDVTYVGGNRLFRWSKAGEEYAVISPDLSKQSGPQITAGGSGAETYGTIVSLAASPLERGLIWVGTDDGNVQVTRDEGKTWLDVTRALPSRLHTYYVKRIEASSAQPGRAYVAIDGHRSDDMAPYLFVTYDYGESWRQITGGLPPHGPVRAIREDPANANLLFAGTEFGLWITFDRGEHWEKFGKLPTVAVDDMAVQPRDHALAVATHGRSIYVLDNLIALENWSDRISQSASHLFPVAPAVEFMPQNRGWFGGSGRFSAPNPEFGAEICYWIRSLADAAPSFTVTDSKGVKVASLTGDRLPGLHRLHWNLHRSEEQSDVFAKRRDRFAAPGLYTVTMEVGKEKQTQPLTLDGSSALAELNLLDSQSRTEPADRDPP